MGWIALTTSRSTSLDAFTETVASMAGAALIAHNTVDAVDYEFVLVEHLWSHPVVDAAPCTLAANSNSHVGSPPHYFGLYSAPGNRVWDPPAEHGR
jgi:hypothetical protein